ncbi:MAG: membrane integrity-associated transporter subunit PqiC [Planctomycetes bacterium]|nr:membrane integrity-associated transporter subunit PqiC [Planctomycetota bacterium]
MRRGRRARLVGLALAALLAACGSVAVPERRTYRLAPPAPAAPDPAAPHGGVLRVGAVELAADLASDRLMVTDGPVRVFAYPDHHWAGPLDRLIADAIVTVLRRAQRFDHVKGETDRGDEDWLLTVRVLDFHQSAEGDRWCALATLDLHLADARGRTVLRAELAERRPLDAADPEALALGLSAATTAALERFLVACAVAGVPRSADSRVPGG